MLMFISNSLTIRNLDFSFILTIVMVMSSYSVYLIPKMSANNN